MKRLIVSIMVFGLASSAIAGPTNVGKYLQLSVNGQVAPDEITIEPSDYVTLGITVLDGHWTDLIQIDLEIIGPGSITLPDPPTDIVVCVVFESWSKFVDGITPKGIGLIQGGTFGQAFGTIVDFIEFHCDDIGDVIVKITNVTLDFPTQIDGSPITEEQMGSIVIHQIPEPASLLLLGLGGLSLRRRR